MNRRVICTVLGLLAAIAVTGTTQAWEVRLRDAVRLQGAVIRLGDVADLSGIDNATERALQRILIAPGPTASRSRVLTISQIRAILRSRGVEMGQCQFSGSSRVVVSMGAGDWEAPAEVAPVRQVSHRTAGGATAVKRIERRIGEDVRQQLGRLSGDAESWQVDVTVTPRAVLGLPASWTDVTVEGLEQPTEGKHRLVARFVSDRGDVRIPLEVRTRRLTQVVVPRRHVERGRTISAADVELKFVDGGSDVRFAVGRLEDVVGRQASRPLAVGRPVTTRSIKEPILVRRREIIDVVARSGQIKITRRAMALDEGARGDTISIETLDSEKTRFVARVVGPRSAEVFVSSPTVPAEAVQHRRTIKGPPKSGLNLE